MATKQVMRLFRRRPELTLKECERAAEVGGRDWLKGRCGRQARWFQQRFYKRERGSARQQARDIIGPPSPLPGR